MIARMIRVLVICLVCGLPAQAWGWSAEVVSVHDGDTMTVKRGLLGKKVKVRLYGIDAPELAQEGGVAARDWLRRRVPLGSTVEVEPISSDDYKRTVALIQSGEEVINEELVAAGHAWVYGKFCKKAFCNEWKQLQRKARQEKSGLWANEKAINPLQWRKQHPRK